MRRRSRQIQAATIILAGQRQLSWPVGSVANAGCREGRSLDRRPALAGDGGFKIPWRGRPPFVVEGGIAAHSTNRMSLDAEPSCDRPPGDALHDPFPTTRPGIRRGHPNQITQWKSQLQEGAAGVFGAVAGAGANAPAVDVKSLHAKIGELTLENDFLEVALGKAGLLSARR